MRYGTRACALVPRSEVACLLSGTSLHAVDSRICNLDIPCMRYGTHAHGLLHLCAVPLLRAVWESSLEGLACAVDIAGALEKPLHAFSCIRTRYEEARRASGVDLACAL